MMKPEVTRNIFLGAAVLALLVFVWPTPYEYVKYQGVLSRVNRFTGVEEFTGSDGWQERKRLEQVAEVQEDIAGEFEIVQPKELGADNPFKGIPFAFVTVRYKGSKPRDLVTVNLALLDKAGVVVAHGLTRLKDVRPGDTVRGELTGSDELVGVSFRIDSAQDDSPVRLPR